MTKVKGFIGFIKDESSSGVVLLLATAVALILANSGAATWYADFWAKNYMGFKIGSFELMKPLYYWINDGLMAIFFFVIGLEIKRELLVGDLSSFKKASLPLVGALGGMIVPAGIFLLLNFSDPAYRNGWAVPMATDIAFALGVMAMLGKRVPLSLKIFLTALAIVDDLGAVLSIALFYTDTINWMYLIMAHVGFLLLMLLNILGVRRLWLYLILGFAIVWVPLLLSGVHATVAGVLIAFTIPARRKFKAEIFQTKLNEALNEFKQFKDPSDTRSVSHEQMESLGEMKEMCGRAESPLQRIEHRLKPVALYLVMPIFALANTGINFSGSETLEGTNSHPVFWGIILGLVLGKTFGIYGFTWLASKLKWVQLPKDITRIQLFGASLLAGIGFTMSLFITDLAFHGDALQVLAKKAIFIASLIAGVSGFAILRFSKRKNL